jgi:hypothetical protein
LAVSESSYLAVLASSAAAVWLCFVWVRSDHDHSSRPFVWNVTGEANLRRTCPSPGGSQAPIRSWCRGACPFVVPNASVSGAGSRRAR